MTCLTCQHWRQRRPHGLGLCTEEPREVTTPAPNAVRVAVDRYRLTNAQDHCHAYTARP